MANFFQKLRGTIETIFQIGLGGPQFRDAGGVIEGRNSADTDYTIIRGAFPVGDNDLVTKKYADSLDKPVIIRGQIDGSAGVPTNTATRGAYVPTTSGGDGDPQIGEIWWSDGTGSGNMENLGEIEGRVIAITDDLTGGTIELDSDTIYIWDADAVEWLKIGDIFGNWFQEAEDTTFQSTTGIAFTEALKLTTPSIFQAGTYLIQWFYVWSYGATSSDFLGRVQVDDTTDLINPDAVDGNQGVHREEPSDAGGGSDGGTDQRFVSSGSAVVALTSGVHTIDVDYASSSAGRVASIHHVRLMIWRVS